MHLGYGLSILSHEIGVEKKAWAILHVTVLARGIAGQS